MSPRRMVTQWAGTCQGALPWVPASKMQRVADHAAEVLESALDRAEVLFQRGVVDLMEAYAGQMVAFDRAAVGRRHGRRGRSRTGGRRRGGRGWAGPGPSRLGKSVVRRRRFCWALGFLAPRETAGWKPISRQPALVESSRSSAPRRSDAPAASSRRSLVLDPQRLLDVERMDRHRGHPGLDLAVAVDAEDLLDDVGRDGKVFFAAVRWDADAQLPLAETPPGNRGGGGSR